MQKNYKTSLTLFNFKTLFVWGFILFVSITNSQTLISPTGDGGFETGSTLAANNWNVVNGTQPNKWFVGTVAVANSGNNSAYISSNATGTTYDYNINSTSVVSIYRDVTIPVGISSVSFSFKWKSSGESCCDYLRVWLTPTTFTPVAGTQTATATGRTQLGGNFNANTTYQTFSSTLTVTAGTSYRLIFEWRNDGSLGPSPGASIDDISLTYIPPPSPTITNLTTPTSGCVGSNITITGTNLSGATAADVKIGGTAVSSITSNNGSTIVAVVGAGTTGTVSVTTSGGTATSIGTFTVNPLPTNPGNPTSDSPQCNPPGVTLTRAATPPGTENYYWQTVSLGTNTSSNGSTYNVTSSSTFYIRAQIISTGCWSSGQGSATVVINNNISTLATSPSPANAATGICYSGSGAITSISWTAAAGATSYDVFFGAGSLPGSVTSNVATNSYSTGTLLASTTYYWRVVPKNSCGNTTGTPITWTFTTAAAICICTPTYADGPFVSDEISNVTLGTLNNSSGGSASPYYTFYNAVTIPNLLQSSTASVSITFGSDSDQFAAVWIDFNQNGIFENTEGVISTVSAGSSGTTIINVPVPAGATLGNTRMRVRGGDDSALTTAQACGASNSTYGETEDYIVNITAPVVCTTPTDQPTSLVLSAITSTSMTGNFTAAVNAPSGYLIVRSSSATPPTLTNGVTYAVGITTLAPGTTRVIQGSAITSNAVTFSDTGLTSNTRYYYHIFSYNTSCTGAPFYNTTTPLTNSAITCPAAPTLPVNSAVTGSGFTVTWTASVAGGSGGTISYILEVYTDAGFTTPIVGSPFSVGTPVTFAVTGLNSGTTYYYRIKANNTSCDSGYVTGSVSTIISNDNCSGTVLLTVNPDLTCAASTTGTTTGGTQSQVGCTGNADDDVWFRFVATGTTHIVTVTPLTLNNAVFEVFSGNCTGLVSTICVNNTTGSNIETTTLTGLTSGQTYYVRVYSNGNPTNTGTFTICVTTPAPPVNNQCANAINLPCSTSNLAGTTMGALNYTHGTGCLMSSYGAWYTFVGDGNSSTISVTTTSNDIELSISYGSCGGLINIACEDSALSSGTESYTFTAALGVNYYVYIANWYSAGTSTDTGSFTISRTCVVPYNPCTSIPNIANCGTATSLTIPAGNGGYSPSSCGWTTPGVEQIYTFTPASTGNFTITQTSSFDYINYQFKPVSAGCNSSGWTCIEALYGFDVSPSFTLTAGTQYYILLDPEVSSGGSVNFTINCPTPPLTNDDPCNAIALTVNTSCSYATYTNSGAAASGGITDPGCASYSGADVWFSAVVPATGVLTVDLQSGVMTDSGMAFYSGNCGSLTLLECDDDDSVNGSMSNISMVGLTPGQTIFIRVWEYGNNNNGTFGICATTPSCPPPSDLYANILSTTSATINWANTSPPSSNGYQYYITTTNSPPTAGSTPTGSTPAGVNGVTLTGLTAGQDYYFWVRAYCGGTDYSVWFGPTNFTACVVGTGNGTTTLACPSIVVGGQGLNGANPAAVICSASTCTNLEATYLQLNQATDYTVASIPYAPPYQYSCLQNPVSVNVDDKWSPIINLPFNFCFYGNNYNKCLIGSNGTITFDTTNNTPGGYSTWSFNTDLPNVSLFKNTIFGVYHDIDPGVGGEVGWELITLNTGCRALVASWDNIPMFSSTCNSSLYTGMIVLYENTNVIDVFIKEKNVCSTWNSGNAIVGVQNSTGTAAVIAPNRNGLSTNWTVTNEAWRFTPSGPSLTSIQWYEGQGTTGTALGTTDVINVCPLITTTYTAEVTYALCNGTNLKYRDNTVVTVNGTKIWDGSTNSNWNVDDNWAPSGVPTSANCIIIPDVANDPIISEVPDGVGYNLLVYPNAQLTINSNQNLTITDIVTVQTNGIFTINNSASLIQINNVLNSGNIIYKRESPSIRTLDYSYWSSPVAGFNVNNIVSPYSFGPIYKWNTTLPNSNAGWGTWQNAAGNTMIAGKGYIARAPGAAPFNNTTYNVLSGSFTGVPNNGNITIPIERGPDQNTANHYGTNGMQITNLSDNWNLLGNPYPSAIRASQFLFDNNTKIEGNVRLWTHGTLPTVIQPSPFYGSYLSNYTPGDYLTYNFTGTSCCPTAASDLFIGAAQGFFVQMIDGPPVAAVDNITVGFTNSLRSATYSNSTFYKMQNATTSSTIDITDIERNRIWLDFINSTNNQTDRILFGYIENASMGRDSFYDCVTQNTGGTIIYSTFNDTKFSIQGRALPFDENDEVPIGINAPATGNYTIGIAAVDGLFERQNIYLKDNLLKITHNLKANPYQFTTQSGEINNRFKVVYIDNALGINNPNEINTFAVISNNTIRVESSELIKEITVYDIAGKLINTYLLNEYKNQFTSPFNYANGVYIAKITLENNMVVSKKLIH